MHNIIVLATNNQNKVKEFQKLVKDFPIEVKCLKDYGPLAGSDRGRRNL